MTDPTHERLQGNSNPEAPERVIIFSSKVQIIRPNGSFSQTGIDEPFGSAKIQYETFASLFPGCFRRMSPLGLCRSGRRADDDRAA